MSDTQKEYTIEERLVWLENRVIRLESVIFPQSVVQAGSGQKQIVGDQRRTDAGMGPLLNANSEFL
jgi:hypothetical protein